METTCSRCHQAVPEESCFCAACGLPQLVYSTEEGGGTLQPERGAPVPQDPSSVDWRSALRIALMLSIPAGLLSCGFSPLGLFSLFWIAAAGAWAVSLYMRRQRTAAISTGAGARIGLVTGMLAAWLALSATGASLFAQRYILHHADEMDREWKTQIQDRSEYFEKLMQQWGVFDAAQFEKQKQFDMTAEGEATGYLFSMCLVSGVLLLSAAGGGALGARLAVRSRRTNS